MSFQEKYKAKLEKNRFIPGWIRLFLFMPGLIMGSYWRYSFTGLYRYLANLQLNIIGSYDTILTGSLMLLVSIVPAVLIMLLIAPYYEHRAINILKGSGETSFSERINIMVHDRPLLSRLYLGGFFGAVIFGGGALYFFLQYSLISSEIIDLAQIQTKGVADIAGPTYATFTGQMDCDTLYLLEENINASHYLIAYTRVTDTDYTIKNIFLENRLYKDEEYCIDGMLSIKGIMRPEGLPGMVRDEYINQGILSPDEEYVTIEYQAKPDHMDGLMGAFAFLAVISFIIFLYIHIKKKPLA